MTEAIRSVRAPRGEYAKTAQRRQQIVDAATAVFAARGYAGGSLRQIAKDLDLSLTSIMHHFTSKEILLEAVLENANRRPLAHFEEVRSAHGLRAAVTWLAEYNLGHPELLRLLAVLSAEASSPSHPAHAWFIERYDTVRSMFRDAVIDDQQHGRIGPTIDPDDAAAAIVATWDGLQLQWLIDPELDMVNRLTRAVARLLSS